MIALITPPEAAAEESLLSADAEDAADETASVVPASAAPEVGVLPWLPHAVSPASMAADRRTANHFFFITSSLLACPGIVIFNSIILCMLLIFVSLTDE